MRISKGLTNNWLDGLRTHLGLEKVLKLGYIGNRPFLASRVVYLRGVSKQPQVKLTDR